MFTGRYANHQRALKKGEIKRVLLEDVVEEEADRSSESEPAASSDSRNLGWARACLELMLRFHGIPFIDLANLRKVDLRNGYLTIRRHKTGMPLSIAVDAAAMKLLRRYASNDPSSPYLLNILNGSLSGKEAYKDYQRALRMLNLQLYRLSRVCRLGKRLFLRCPSYLGLYCKILRNSCGGDFRSVGPCFNHYYGRLSEAVR